MQTLDAPFPGRPVNLTPLKPQSLMGLFWAALVFLLIGGILVWALGPLLIRDLQIGNNVVPALHAHMVKGECKSRAFIFHWCDIKVEHGRGRDNRQSALSYLFIDEPMAKHSVVLLAAKDNPREVTTELGQQTLWNRTSVLAAFLLFCGAPLVILPMSWARRSRTKRDFPALSSQPLELVAVDMVQQRSAKSRQWQYNASGQKRWPPIGVTLPKDAVPFFLDPAAKTALAVKSQAAPSLTPMLLDAGLTSLELSGEERQALWQWQAARFEAMGTTRGS
jgi:hypothetical protein